VIGSKVWERIRHRLASLVNRLFRRPRFENRAFWNERYVRDPAKGSGPGSRGEKLALKNRLIRDAIERFEITSVLDIGCGDIAILEGMEMAHYVGIDISDVIVARNRVLRPDWRFENIDAAADDETLPSADLVLCLDVLIHQKSRLHYERIVQRALAGAKKLAMISGHAQPSGGWNVFFHEPIGQTIRRARPDACLRVCAGYRNTEIYLVELPAGSEMTKAATVTAAVVVGNSAAPPTGSARPMTASAEPRAGILRAAAAPTSARPSPRPPTRSPHRP
jgi:SAM-dependent methyltransferase